MFGMKHTQAATRTPSDAHAHTRIRRLADGGTNAHRDAQVCKHVRMHANTQTATHSHTITHTITQVGDYLHKYREEREPEIAEMLHISLTTCWAQTVPAAFPHAAWKVRCISIHAFTVCTKHRVGGIISDLKISAEE